MKNYYTEEERKNDFYWECEYFGFTSNYELSKPIKITQLFSIIPEKYQTQLMNEIMQFTWWWTTEHYKRLDGFTGFDTIEFVKPI